MPWPETVQAYRHYLLYSPVLSVEYPTGQVSDIISAEHCQHSSTCLPSYPYSQGFLDRHYMTSSTSVPRSCQTLSFFFVFFLQTSLAGGSERVMLDLCPPKSYWNHVAYFHGMWESHCARLKFDSDLDNYKPPYLDQSWAFWWWLLQVLRRSQLIVTF